MSAATQTALPAWSQRLISALDAADQCFETLAKGLTTEQLNWRPAAEAWSIGQCLQHLHITNEVYLPAISVALEGQPRFQVEEIKPGWFGRWFIRTFIDSSGKRRTRAPKKINPGPRVEPSVLDSLLRSNQAARELIARAGHYDVNRIRFRNPFISGIRFTVGTGLEIVSKHQSRHLLQAERVKESVAFPERQRQE